MRQAKNQATCSAGWCRFFGKAPQAGASDGAALTNQATVDALADRVWNGEADYWDTPLFEFISKDLLNALETGLKSPKARGIANQGGITYNAPDDAFRTALEQNLFHFSAAKTLAEVQQLNQALRDSDGYADFRRRADRITSTFNRTWQRTEYGTAVNCAENASTYRRLKSEADIFPYWQYCTVGDDRVREEHAALDGLILRHDDPLWDKIYPPNGWKCRCYVVPKMAAEVNVSEQSQHQRVEEYMKTTDWKNAEAQHWDINRAKQGLVFAANQMYIRKFPDNAASYMDRVKPDRWGLEPSVKKLQQQATEAALQYNGTPDEFWEAHKQVIDGREYLVVKDYNGREWRMDREAYVIHTTDNLKKRAFRLKHLPNVFEVASQPDEVWLGQEYKDKNKGDDNYYLSNYIMIKHYKGVSIAVVGKIENGELVWKTWYPVRDNNVRKGLLIRRKV